MFYVCYFAAGRIETWQWARAYFQISQAVKKKKKKKCVCRVFHQIKRRGHPSSY